MKDTLRNTHYKFGSDSSSSFKRRKNIKKLEKMSKKGNNANMLIKTKI